MNKIKFLLQDNSCGPVVESTVAPLRHFQSPEESLTGEGHKVCYLGQTLGPIPSAIYRSTDPQGRAWRVAVNYVSARGEFATHVDHAMRLWLQAPAATWSMVERITPWEWTEDVADRFDIAVWRTLNLSPLLHRPDFRNLSIHFHA